MYSMKAEEKNLILIGMPGVGKSTVGVVAAKRLGFGFTDSDLLIQDKYGKLLHELIEENGIEGFWKIENDVNAAIQKSKTVIATGGSACYGEEAMKHLREIGVIVYLKLGYESLCERLGDLNARGVTLRPGQDLHGLLEERTPLYEKYAHITIDCEKKQLREVVHELCDAYLDYIGKTESI